MQQKHVSTPKPLRARRDEVLERARQPFCKRARSDAHQSLLFANQETQIEADDLDLLAVAAYLVGRDDEYSEPSNAPTTRT